MKRPYLLLAVIPFILMGYTAAAIAVIPLIYFIARKQNDPSDLLAILGLIILIFCELFYLKDNMGDTYFRMNTIFKCYLPAWILLGIAAFAMAGKWLLKAGGYRLFPPGIRPLLPLLLSAYFLLFPFVDPVYYQLWNRYP